MFDIVKSDRVYYGGRKWHVSGASDTEAVLISERENVMSPAGELKPVIRLTPLVRAEMLIQAISQSPPVPYGYDCTLKDGAVIHQHRVSEALGVIRAADFIQSIGGYEAAQLYTDCDGYVNGRFIRGDDVRRALRILEGL